LPERYTLAFGGNASLTVLRVFYNWAGTHDAVSCATVDVVHAGPAILPGGMPSLHDGLEVSSTAELSRSAHRTRAVVTVAFSSTATFFTVVLPD
jgi:hypothetical protein